MWSSRRNALTALAGALTFCVALLAGASTASADVVIEVVPDIASPLVVGQSAPSSLTIRNANTAPEDVESDTVTEITLVPSCGQQPVSADCPAPFLDRGVLRPSTSGTGRLGSACAGQSFSIAEIDGTQGKYRFTPLGAVVIGPPGSVTDRCTIDYTTDVLRLPAVDGDGPAAGLQTFQSAFAQAFFVSNFGSDAGSAAATITTTPAITAFVAAQEIGLGATFTDTATLASAAGSSAPTGTVTFDLYGPDDPACSGPPALSSTNALDAAGTTAASDAFAPTAAGTYRVVARYDGDAIHNRVSTACGDATQTVVVTARPAAADGPQILSAGFASQPIAGRTAELIVVATDPKEPISGLQVRFGEARGRSGVSACRVPSLGRPADPVTLRVPYGFRLPGVHRVVIVVLSGDCTGALRHTETTIDVIVAPALLALQALPASSAAGAAGAPIAARAARVCPDRFLTPTAAPAVRARVAAAVLCLVNAERSRRGRRKLRRSPRLAFASAAHAKDMLLRRYFQHERVPGGPALRSRLLRAGYRGSAYAENIGYGSNYNATLMVRVWMNSPGHRANILDPRLRFGGVGLAIGVPFRPSRPGATYVNDFGRTAR